MFNLQESGSVRQAPDQHSLLPLPQHFVVAGDRFREEYYWDSYWIVQGLLICGLVDTAKVLPVGAPACHSYHCMHQQPLSSDQISCCGVVCACLQCHSRTSQ